MTLVHDNASAVGTGTPSRDRGSASFTPFELVGVASPLPLPVINVINRLSLTGWSEAEAFELGPGAGEGRNRNRESVGHA